MIDGHKNVLYSNKVEANWKQYSCSHLFAFFVVVIFNLSWYSAILVFLSALERQLDELGEEEWCTKRASKLEYLSRLAWYWPSSVNSLSTHLAVALSCCMGFWLSSRVLRISIASSSNFHSFFGFDSMCFHKQDCCDFIKSTACFIVASTLLWRVFFWLSISFLYSPISIASHSLWFITSKRMPSHVLWKWHFKHWCFLCTKQPKVQRQFWLKNLLNII